MFMLLSKQIAESICLFVGRTKNVLLYIYIYIYMPIAVLVVAVAFVMVVRQLVWKLFGLEPNASSRDSTHQIGRKHKQNERRDAIKGFGQWIISIVPPGDWWKMQPTPDTERTDPAARTMDESTNYLQFYLNTSKRCGSCGKNCMQSAVAGVCFWVVCRFPSSWLERSAGFIWLFCRCEVWGADHNMAVSLDGERRVSCGWRVSVLERVFFAFFFKYLFDLVIGVIVLC